MMATGNAKRFVELGLAPALSIELAKQITANAGDGRRLRELGITPGLSALIVPAIAAHTVNLMKLSEMGWPARVSREFNTQITS
jgi:Fe2+ transport system protein FeoA